MIQKLNLGCGHFKKEGYINVDIFKQANPDVIHDLEKFPYPFKNACFNIIEADHVLEHLNDVIKVIGELNRILKPQGILVIRVPHFSRAMTHPQHKRGFDVTFPNYFDDNFIGGYSGIKFVCDNVKLRWFSQKYLMKKILPQSLYYLLSGLGKIIDFAANLSPMFCSRIWCYWVGGFYEIEFIFKKP